MLSIPEQIQLLSRRCERILNEQDLTRKLESSAKTGKPLRIKFGMDPTAPDVTLGHTVPLKVIRQFQDLGQKAVLIIGDYTARVGDPSGRNATRPVLSGEEIDANARTYVAQVQKILLSDPAHLEYRYNGEWLAKLNLVDIIKLASRKTVAQMLAREDFANRYAQQVDIRLHEILYPLLQGYDSVMIDADVEMGGSDQLFNNLVGRELQKEDGKEGQVVMVTPLLVGTDGVNKMSKSKKNYIAVTEAPNTMFGKIMSIPDALLENYYRLLTDLGAAQYEPAIARDPRQAKIELAKTLIAWLHDAPAAEAAQSHFQKVIVEKQAPAEMPELGVTAGRHHLPSLLVEGGLATTKSEAIRKMREGAVRVDGIKAIDPSETFPIARPVVLQLGNRKYVRLVPSEAVTQLP